MATRARFKFTAATALTFDAARYVGGETGDVPQVTYAEVTSPGLDGSRHVERRKVWPVARVETDTILSTWDDCELILSLHRERVGEQITPEQLISTGSSTKWYTMLKKRIVRHELRGPHLPISDGFILRCLWTLQYEGGP